MRRNVFIATSLF